MKTPRPGEYAPPHFPRHFPPLPLTHLHNAPHQPAKEPDLSTTPLDEEGVVVRMSRWAWLQAKMPPWFSPRKTREPRAEQVTKEPATWDVSLPGPAGGLAFRVTAHSASEARAAVKVELRLTRLPVGSEVRRVG